MKNKAITLNSIQFGTLLLLIVFHLIGWPLGVNLLIVVFGISFFFHSNLKNKVTDVLNDKFFLLSLIPISIYAFSLIHTKDLSEGLKNVSTKLPLLLMPIILNVIYKPKNDELWKIAKLFVWGVTLLGITGFLIQYQSYLKTGDSGFFYNDNLGSAFEKQAVYFAWFTNSAICILLFGWKKILGRYKRHSIWGILFLLILVTIQVLLASRTSLAIMFGLLFFFGIYKIFNGISKKKVILASFTIFFTIVLSIIAFPKVLNRFKSITQINYRLDNPNPLNHFNGTYSEDNWDGLSARLAIWECTWSAIIKQPYVGCGIGDVSSELQKVYREKKFILGQNNNFNTHNQFLDLWITAGILGLAIFLLSTIYMLYNLIKQKQLLFFILWIILLLSLLTENIFNRNQGVMFVGLLIGLTAHVINDERKNRI
jgi:O-antigen ligase